MRSIIVLLLVILISTIVSIANINIVEQSPKEQTVDNGILKFYKEFDARALYGETIHDPYIYKGGSH